MRYLGQLLGVIVVTGAAWCLSGCGGSSIEEGMPQNIDMTKDYSPAAKVNMVPGAQKKMLLERKAAKNKDQTP